jgi:hypothetical protein
MAENLYQFVLLNVLGKLTMLDKNLAGVVGKGFDEVSDVDDTPPCNALGFRGKYSANGSSI